MSTNSAIFTLALNVFNYQGCHSQGKYLENEFFSGQGKVREFCKWSRKFRKDFESQGKVREFKMAMSGRLRKIIYSIQ